MHSWQKRITCTSVAGWFKTLSKHQLLLLHDAWGDLYYWAATRVVINGDKRAEVALWDSQSQGLAVLALLFSDCFLQLLAHQHVQLGYWVSGGINSSPHSCRGGEKLIKLSHALSSKLMFAMGDPNPLSSLFAHTSWKEDKIDWMLPDRSSKSVTSLSLWTEQTEDLKQRGFTLLI